MYQPRPHGRLAVGGTPSDVDAAAIELLARRLTNLRRVSGVESLRMVRDLPDGGYVIAQDMGGVFRAITHKPEVPPPPPPFDGLAKAYIPMLFSGVITDAIVPPDRGVGVRLTEQARRRLANYLAENTPAKEHALARFRIGYNSQVREFEPEMATQVFYSQYAAQRPTWYSGAMAEVMQIVGGYGRQDLGELPDTPVERARMQVPEKILGGIIEELGNRRLPGYTGFPDRQGKFQYDYKFNNTDAVSFDSSGKPWLIRIQPNGVWAMPFPLIPATTTNAFREYMETVGDDEITAILDRFGGMPSGETFPAQAGDFEAWRRAGVIIKVCDVGDFYDHIAYASACGWALNSRGSEGFNTCYDYYDEEGLGYGLAYKMALFLSPADEDGRLPGSIVPADMLGAERLNAYLGGLYRLLANNTAEHLAIKYKLRRVDVGLIQARAANREPDQGEVNYWNTLELEPIASHTGRVAEVARGYLHHAADFMYQPQIKFPEPFEDGCVSHNFLPLMQGRNQASYPNCDTIMFGYYVDDVLKVVKYFRDERTFQQEVENDYEDCMIVGAWSQTETTGSSSLVGHFYTTDFDDRRALAPVVEQTKITGKDLGFDSVPFFAFDDFFWRPGTMWRNRYFSTHRVVERSEGQSLDVAICIPYLNRNAVLHARREAVTGKRTTETLGMSSVRDPTSYRYWTHHSVHAWIGGLEVSNGKPYPENGSPVWVEIENYDPYPCSDFADQGSWVPALPADYTWLIHPYEHTWFHSGGGGAPAFNPYSKTTDEDGEESGNLKISILPAAETVHKNIPNAMYFLGSPDPFVGVFYRDACRAVFGETTYANVSENGEGGRRAHWGYTALADHQSAHHFIGVINE